MAAPISTSAGELNRVRLFPEGGFAESPGRHDTARFRHARHCSAASPRKQAGEGRLVDPRRLSQDEIIVRFGLDLPRTGGPGQRADQAVGIPRVEDQVSPGRRCRQAQGQDRGQKKTTDMVRMAMLLGLKGTTINPSPVEGSSRMMVRAGDDPVRGPQTEPLQGEEGPLSAGGAAGLARSCPSRCGLPPGQDVRGDD